MKKIKGIILRGESSPICPQIPPEADKSAEDPSFATKNIWAAQGNSSMTKEHLAAIEIHKHWGPGLYEEIYGKSLYHELRLRNISCENRVFLPLIYKGERIGNDLRLDLIVQAKVIVEAKAVKQLGASGSHQYNTL